MRPGLRSGSIRWAARRAYWEPIIERYRIAATVVNEAVDPTFRFMTADWDGKIRMDCSSPYAMTRLIGMRDKFDVAFANDTDADRHGIVTRSPGLMNPNHYLASRIDYLFAEPSRLERHLRHRQDCRQQPPDRPRRRPARPPACRVPVGFKWFVDGLLDGSLGFGGEESAGASFLRRDGSVWTTDKDGLILGLLAAEITARVKHDPGEAYDRITRTLGVPFYERIDAPATAEQRRLLKTLSPDRLGITQLAGEAVSATYVTAPGNNAPIGGIKMVAASGWFAVRPSGTEDVYKIYAESFRNEDHLRQIQQQVTEAVADVFAAQPAS